MSAHWFDDWAEEAAAPPASRRRLFHRLLETALSRETISAPEGLVSPGLRPTRRGAIQAAALATAAAGPLGSVLRTQSAGAAEVVPDVIVCKDPDCVARAEDLRLHQGGFCLAERAAGKLFAPLKALGYICTAEAFLAKEINTARCPETLTYRSFDDDNCGRCGNVCPHGTYCFNGGCKSGTRPTGPQPPDPLPWTDNANCAPGQTGCGASICCNARQVCCPTPSGGVTCCPGSDCACVGALPGPLATPAPTPTAGVHDDCANCESVGGMCCGATTLPDGSVTISKCINPFVSVC